MKLVSWRMIVSIGLIVAAGGLGLAAHADPPAPNPDPVPTYPLELPDDPPVSASELARLRATAPAATWTFGDFTSIQVNVTAVGENILNDAANEPSIAVDPIAPSRIAIGWRQFDSITSNFRQAGWSYSHDAGQTWTFPGVLEAGIFRSDPVLGADADGNFYYYSLRTPNNVFVCDMYKSFDGGKTWGQPVYAFGGDKAWFDIDRTDGPGRGNIYAAWNSNAACCGTNIFNRSLNGGESFSFPVAITHDPKFGTVSVAPDGSVFVVGGLSSGPISEHWLARSTNAPNPVATPTFNQNININLGGSTAFGIGSSPNPAGLLGQIWVATDHSTGPNHGNVYVLASVDPPGADPLDVMFIRSTDNGVTFSSPIRINDDPTNSGAWQWFGTMSVAPNGRIDVIWNDTRVGLPSLRSALFYASSLDGGLNWSENQQISPSFDHSDGYPQQNKLGDYYDMISDNQGVHVAYAATFNGEQDVYYVRIGNLDCNGNGLPDQLDIVRGISSDCNENEVPDECEPDCNSTGIVDICDLAAGTSEDCDSNNVPDECDPNFDGDSWIDACDFDIDDDGIVNERDQCDFTPQGVRINSFGRPVADTDGSCRVDLGDVSRLMDCILAGGPLFVAERGCSFPFDYDADNHVGLFDFAKFQNEFEPQ